MWKIFILLGSLFVFTACNNSDSPRSPSVKTSLMTNPSPSPTVSSKTTPSSTELTASFPSSVDLTFKPLHMDPLKEGKPNPEWSLIKEISFGEVKQKPIRLAIYQEPATNNSSPYMHAFVRVQNTYFAIENELMEIPSVEHSTLYVMQHSFSDKFILQGGIQLFANGPGDICYIVYDPLNDNWLTFIAWGIPQFIDLDSDGEEEFVVQFEGLHLQFPDVFIYTWENGSIEGSESINTAVLGNTPSRLARLGTDKTIAVGTADGARNAKYVYKNRKLIKQ